MFYELFSALWVQKCVRSLKKVNYGSRVIESFLSFWPETNFSLALHVLFFLSSKYTSFTLFDYFLLSKYCQQLTLHVFTCSKSRNEELTIECSCFDKTIKYHMRGSKALIGNSESVAAHKVIDLWSSVN